MTYSKSYRYVSPQDFINIWQHAKNVTEVSYKTGQPKNTLYKRAEYYRKKGINLKRFKVTEPLDFIELNKKTNTSSIIKATCSKCKGTEFKLKDRRNTSEGPVFRKKECIGCGTVIKTYEISAEDLEYLMSGERLHILWSKHSEKKIESAPAVNEPIKELMQPPKPKLPKNVPKKAKEFIDRFGKDKLVI